MDNVLNRPLFRHREARDRLNESVGVQRFNVGGGVVAGAGNPDFGGGSRAPQGVYADPSGAVMPQYRRAPIRPAGLASLSTAQEDTMAEDRGLLFSNALLVAAREKVEMAQRRFENDPSGINQQRYADAVAELEAAQGENATVMEEYNPGPISNIQDRGVLDVEGPEAMVSQMSPEQLDIFNNLGRAAENVVPDTAAPKPVPVGPSGMEIEARRGRPMGPSGMEAEARRARPPAPGEELAPLGRSTMEADARDRGPLISNPADVAAGLNAEDPAARERTLTDFMKEFTDAAPKYEGADKGLLLAQIGFAIAAGESPNAMQNIANGLLAGSDMMLKDKAAKDEFNRQVQLSAMQYGFGEAASQRALERQFTDYVASREVTYRGKKYGPNESIPVLHSDIISGRMPDGVVSESMNDAMLTTDATIRKALLEAEKEGRLAPEQYRQTIAELDKAASDFSKARNTIPLIESSIIRNADGMVTGLKANAMKAINQAASFVNIDLGAEYESPQAYDSAMQTVAARMVQDILGESGANISNVDRELVANIVGVAAGGYGNAFKDPQVLNAKLQEILQQAEGKQQSALDTYNTLMEGFGSTESPSGTPVRSIRADRVFAPEQPVQDFEYTIDESGRYVKRYLDGGN